MDAAAGPGARDMVSVIVPTHNRARHLRRALASVRAQTWQRIQLIVIANGCIDNTAQVAREFQRELNLEAQDSARIEFVFREFKESLGGARARNIGMDCARGEYIAFLDDDDCWHPHKLAAQIELINRHDCALVGCAHYYLFGAFGAEFARPAGVVAAAGESTALRFDDLLCENKLGGFSHCLTRRAALGDSRIDERLQALQDWDLWLKILGRGDGDGVARISCARHVFYRVDGARISNRYAHIDAAQRIFLCAWRDRFDAPSVAYHEMRNRCFQHKARAGESRGMLFWFAVIAGWPRLIKTISRSSERRNLKRYLHYMLFPLIDIDAMRMRLWRIGRGKNRAHKIAANGA